MRPFSVWKNISGNNVKNIFVLSHAHKIEAVLSLILFSASIPFFQLALTFNTENKVHKYAQILTVTSLQQLRKWLGISEGLRLPHHEMCEWKFIRLT